jgi:hypothetical protein
MRHFILPSLWACLLVTGLQAQELRGRCGTTTADQKMIDQRLTENLIALENNPAIAERGNVTYIPTYFHLVGTARGASRLRMRQLLDAFCLMNREYAEHNIQFYLSPHPDGALGFFNTSINDDDVMLTQSNVGLMTAVRHPNAINYFIVETPNPSNLTQPGVILGYYSPGRDWLVIRRTEMTTQDVSTIAHETGHHFSLQHTMFGWEEDDESPNPERPCFEASDPGWPRAPIVSPLGPPTERVDGSNCRTAADRICDTPPDYNFGFCLTNCSPYSGGAQDPAGQVVDPMENNMMSYFLRCADYKFTEGQATVMRTDIAASRRRHLRNSFVPVTTTVTTPGNILTAPVGGSIVPGSTSVLLEWRPVEGATRYLVEVDASSAFTSILLQEAITANTALQINNLLPNRTYSWRVRAFNEYVTCGIASGNATFRTSPTSSTTDIASINDWKVLPNLVSDQNSVILALQAAESFKANLKIVDATGRSLYTQSGLSFGVGDNNVSIPVEILPNGMYFMLLENNQGVSVRRLAVSKL